MSTAYLIEAAALRDRAWADLQQSPAYALVKALDAAVVAGGGTSVLPSDPKAQRPILAKLNAPPAVAYANVAKRISQGDAAALVLEENGPTMGVDLLNAIPEKGGFVGGTKPMISLTSTMSKDARFLSFRHDGNYFWWFVDRPLPKDWNTGGDLGLGLDTPPASSPSNQEGGDGHAANNTP